MQRWFEIRAAAEGAEVVIYDAIGGFGLSAKAFTDELKRFATVPILQVRINSPGGDVFEGLAIHNALARHPARKVVSIDGLAASIASVVAMAGDEIVMPANAMLMLHEPSAAVVGRAQELRQMADGLDRIRAAMAAIYAGRTGRDPDHVGRLMDAETWLSASEALALGFADRIDPPVRMAARFDLSVFANAPPALTTHAPPAPAALSHPRPTAKEPLTMPNDLDREPVNRVTHAPTPEPSPSTPAPAAAIDVDAVSAARADALAYAAQVTELCVLARMPERASAFIAANAPLAEVGRALLKARAETDAEEIVAIQPAALRAKDHGWGPVIESRFGKRS